MALADINQTTIANLISQAGADAQEVLWVASVMEDTPQFNPFTELMGGRNSVMPIKNVLDTQKVGGQEIVLTNYADLGGTGISGDDTTLLGNEEKIKMNTFRLFIGLQRHAVGREALIRDQTLIGKKGNVDGLIRESLRKWMSRTKSDCIEAEMISVANASTQNVTFAGNKSSLDQLTTADYLDEETIISSKNRITGLGGKPINVSRDGLQYIPKYYLQGNDGLFDGLKNNGGWKSILADAGDRGKTNWLFGGNLPDYDGVMLNNWIVQNSSADSAKGAFCKPEAYLGVAIPARTTANTFDTSIKGGGYNADSGLNTIAVAKTQNDYFRYFPNAPFLRFDRTIIAADTSTTRYVAIQHASGADVGKFSFLSYTTTDGKTLGASDGSDLKRLGSTAAGDYETTLTGSTIAWASGPWAGYVSEAEIPVGSLIVPVNSKGQAWARGYLLANDAIVVGSGTYDGSLTSALGKRIVDVQDYGNRKGEGVAAVWGVKAVENAAKIKPGFIVIYGARSLPGQPPVV